MRRLSIPLPGLTPRFSGRPGCRPPVSRRGGISRPGGLGRWRRRAVVAVCLCRWFGIGCALWSPGGSVSAGETEPRRLVLMTVHLHNRTSAPLRDVALRLPLPVTNAYQRVYGVDCAPVPFETRDVPASGHIGLFRFPRIGAGESAWAFCLIDCRLRAFAPRRLARTPPLPRALRSACLGPGDKVNPAAPEVAAVAREIGPADADRMQTARRINDWLVAHCVYELDDEQLDAAGVLKARRGSCSELARAFAALARHYGIPARFATGSRLRVDTDGYTDRVHHRWLELYVRGYGWFPVDVSRNVVRAENSLRFGSIPARYLALLRTAGLPEDPLHATNFTLVNRDAAAALVRRVRFTWWRHDRDKVLRRLIRRIRSAASTPARRRRLARTLLGRNDPAAAPFLAMLLYPPFSPETAESAARRLERIGPPHALSPLVDRVAADAVDPGGKEAQLALERLTGKHLASGDEWRLWLRGAINRVYRRQDAEKIPPRVR